VEGETSRLDFGLDKNKGERKSRRQSLAKKIGRKDKGRGGECEGNEYPTRSEGQTLTLII